MGTAPENARGRPLAGSRHHRTQAIPNPEAASVSSVTWECAPGGQAPSAPGEGGKHVYLHRSMPAQVAGGGAELALLSWSRAPLSPSTARGGALCGSWMSPGSRSSGWRGTHLTGSLCATQSGPSAGCPLPPPPVAAQRGAGWRSGTVVPCTARLVGEPWKCVRASLPPRLPPGSSGG